MKRNICQYDNIYVTGSVKVCQVFHRIQGVYVVLGFFYEPFLSLCDVR